MMQSGGHMKRSIYIVITLLVAPNLFAAPPATQPARQFQLAPEFKWPTVTTPPFTQPDNAFKLPNLDLTLRPANIAKDVTGPTQTWHSFKFNGSTTWVRPAVMDGRNTVVRDDTTGKWYLHE